MSKLLKKDYVAPIFITELVDEIEYELANNKIDKRTLDYKRWKNQMQQLINSYNKQVGFNSYMNISSYEASQKDN